VEKDSRKEEREMPAERNSSLERNETTSEEGNN
jgi:hypothetical protein